MSRLSVPSCTVWWQILHSILSHRPLRRSLPTVTIKSLPRNPSSHPPSCGQATGHSSKKIMRGHHIYSSMPLHQNQIRCSSWPQIVTRLKANSQIPPKLLPGLHTEDHISSLLQIDHLPTNHDLSRPYPALSSCYNHRCLMLRPCLVFKSAP
jgi:hypothetical protein